MRRRVGESLSADQRRSHRLAMLLQSLHEHSRRVSMVAPDGEIREMQDQTVLDATGGRGDLIVAHCAKKRCIVTTREELDVFR